MHCDKLARASDKAVAFETALVSLNIVPEKRRRCMERRETALFVCGFGFPPAGEYQCTGHHMDGWMACMLDSWFDSDRHKNGTVSEELPHLLSDFRDTCVRQS